MPESIATFVLAGYADAEVAERDYRELRNLDQEGRLDLVDAAIVHHDEDGHVGIEKDLRHPVRKGVVIGGVLALLSPLSIFAGVIGGAVAGKLAAHFHKGLSRQDIKDLGEVLDRSSIALVAVVRGATAEALGTALASTDKVLRPVTGTDAAFSDLLQQYDSTGWVPPDAS